MKIQSVVYFANENAKFSAVPYMIKSFINAKLKPNLSATMKLENLMPNSKNNE